MALGPLVQLVGPGRPDHEKEARARAVLPLDGPRLVVVLGCTVGAGQTVTTLVLADLLADEHLQAPASVLAGLVAAGVLDLQVAVLRERAEGVADHRIFHDKLGIFRDDGGNEVHPDQHTLWIDPKDGRHMIVGCDGGFYATYDRMAHWDFLSDGARVASMADRVINLFDGMVADDAKVVPLPRGMNGVRDVLELRG